MTNDSSRGRAQLESEFGPYADKPCNGVAHDGTHLWVASGQELRALDPTGGEVVRTLPIAADAGTAFDGTHLFQLADTIIQKIDTTTGEVVASIPAPGEGRDSGLTWAEGTLWVGQYRDRKIHQIDPDTGKILKTIESDRFVTGVTWTGGELWHATLEDDASEVRRIDPTSGDVLERFDAPAGVAIAGLCSDGERFYCGSGREGKVRTIRPPR